MDKKKVLVVDDQALICAAVKRVLEDAGHEVFPAYDGEDGLQAAMMVNRDLIITDCAMPIMDGPELCRKLRAFPATRDVPIVMMSGTFTEEVRASVATLNISAFLDKPFTNEALLTAVKKALGK